MHALLLFVVLDDYASDKESIMEYPSIETFTFYDWRVSVYYDTSESSPRKWSNIATFLIWSREVVSPDKADYSSLDDFMENWDDANGVMYFVEHVNYGGGNTKYRITEDRDRADGVIFATYATLDVELCDYTPGLVRDHFESELLTYTQYANGEVYGFSIEQYGPSCEWSFVDGVGGYVGSLDGAIDSFPAEVPDELVAMCEASSVFGGRAKVGA
jgi:hypothetical protein